MLEISGFDCTNLGTTSSIISIPGFGASTTGADLAKAAQERDPYDVGFFENSDFYRRSAEKNP